MEAVSEACDLDNYFKLKVFPYPHCLQYFSSPHSHHPPPLFFNWLWGVGGWVFCLAFVCILRLLLLGLPPTRLNGISNSLLPQRWSEMIISSEV